MLLALSTVEGSERSLPAVAGVGGSKLWWLCAMNDNSTIIVILSERSESKDLYLSRLLRPPQIHRFSPPSSGLTLDDFSLHNKAIDKILHLI